MLTGYYGYMVAREYIEESSLGIGNEILRGIMELGIVGFVVGKDTRGGGSWTTAVVMCPVPTSLTSIIPSTLSSSFLPCHSGH